MELHPKELSKFVGKPCPRRVLCRVLERKWEKGKKLAQKIGTCPRLFLPINLSSIGGFGLSSTIASYESANHFQFTPEYQAMKFAHSFSQALEEEDFPADWQAAAIRYRQLKKCIKKVQKELSELGLTVEILKSGMIVEEGDQTPTQGPLFQYMFDGSSIFFSEYLWNARY